MKVGNLKVVPITLVLAAGGLAQAFIAPVTIPHEKWTTLHGETLDGQKVNSPKIAQLAETNDTIIQSGDGYFAIPNADFEVLCAQGAQRLGYQVKPGNKRTTAA